MLGIHLPVIQAPMAGVQDARLAIAVSEAGGLGSLPAAQFSLPELEQQLRLLQQGTDKPYNVNCFCHAQPVPDAQQQADWLAHLQPYFDEYGIDASALLPLQPARQPFNADVADTLAAFRPPVVSFHFGLPDAKLLEYVKSWDAIVLSSATTVEEGLWLEAHGADAVIAQGLEAGGHRGHFLSDDLSLQTGTFALVPLLAKHLQVPVIAAGGVAGRHTARAALALGAAGVQAGTAYLLAHEAATSALHRQALQGEGAHHTALTRTLTGRPARGLVNRLMADLAAVQSQAPAFPLAGSALTRLRQQAEAVGKTDFSPLWSGQNNQDLLQQPAADITIYLGAGVEPDQD